MIKRKITWLNWYTHTLFTLVFIVGSLNLIMFNNYIALPLFGGRSLSYPYFALLLFLFISIIKKNYNWTLATISYYGFICVYVFFAFFAYVFHNIIFKKSSPIIDLPSLIRAFILCLMTIFVVSKYISNFKKEKLHTLFITIILIFAIGNCITIYQFIGQEDWLSGKTSEEVGWQLIERASGLYMNPNTAGFAAIISIATCLTYILSNFKFKIIALIGLVIGIIAGGLTFSKTFFLNLFLQTIFFFFFLFRNRKTIKGGNKILIGSVIFIVMFITAGISNFIATTDLSDEQSERLYTIFNILSGQSQTSDLTSSRFNLAEYALDFLIYNPILGYGYGFFTNLLGSESINNGIAQGVHNIYLRVWGDAGILSLVIYISAIITIFFSALKIKQIFLKFFSITLFFAYVFFNATNHNVFEDYLSSTTLGLILGILSLKRQ